MNNNEYYALAVEILKEQGLKEDRINPDSRLEEDLKLYDLDLIFVLGDVGERTKRTLTNEEIDAMKTVQDMVNYLEKYDPR